MCFVLPGRTHKVFRKCVNSCSSVCCLYNRGTFGDWILFITAHLSLFYKWKASCAVRQALHILRTWIDMNDSWFLLLNLLCWCHQVQMYEWLKLTSHSIFCQYFVKQRGKKKTKQSQSQHAFFFFFVRKIFSWVITLWTAWKSQEKHHQQLVIGEIFLIITATIQIFPLGLCAEGSLKG